MVHSRFTAELPFSSRISNKVYRLVLRRGNDLYRGDFRCDFLLVKTGRRTPSSDFCSVPEGRRQLR